MPEKLVERERLEPSTPALERGVILSGGNMECARFSAVLAGRTPELG